MHILIVSLVSLTIQPALVHTNETVVLQRVTYENSRLELSATRMPIVQVHKAALTAFQEDQRDSVSKPSEKAVQPTKVSNQNPQTNPGDSTASAQPNQQERRPFWERVFNVPPMRTRIEKALNEKWKFTDVRPRHIEMLLSDDEETTRRFFLDGANARMYQKLLAEYGCGFETRNGRIVDDSFETLAEYGPELISNYAVLMENRDLIKRYYAGLFRDGRISTQSLIRVSSSVWFGPFETPKFRMFAGILHSRFQVPEHVIGPMLSSVGDSYWLPKVMSRKTSPQEFRQLLNKIAQTNDGAANAFAPALQLMVLAEEYKIPFRSLDSFVSDLNLKPKDFGPFSAMVYNLRAYRIANEIKCPTFAQFLRRELDEFGPDINQESGRLFVHAYMEFKENSDALQSLLSSDYSDTKAFLKTVGTVNSNVWNMQRIAFLTQTLTPEKRAKIAKLARELATELSVADIVFLADIVDNEEECKLLMDRPALIAGVKDIPIDRIVERSRNDLIKELEREIDNANRNGLYRTVRRLATMLKEEKMAYTERVDPNKLSNIQLSRLLIFHRSLNMPGFLETVGWNVSKDLQNDRSEGGGYLGYDKDMAMVTMVAGQPGDNKAYRPLNLNRASASLALFHNHAFKDTFAQRYLNFLSFLLPTKRNKDKYAGPSGWLGAEKGDITAAAQSELPSFIITKIGHPKNPDGTQNLKAISVNFDWVIVDQQSGEALRSDRGVYTVPYFGDEELGKLKWPSKREMKRQERERREKCPPLLRQFTETR